MGSPDAKTVFGLVSATALLAACAPAESQGQNNQQEFTSSSINALLTEYSSFDIALPNGALQGAELKSIAVQETGDKPDVLSLTSESGEVFTASVATATLVTEKGESTEVLVLVRHENKDILVLRSEQHPSIDTEGIAHSDGKIAVLDKGKKQLAESTSSSFEATFDTNTDTGVIWLTIGKTTFTVSDESEDSVMTKVVALLSQPEDVQAADSTPTSAAPKVEPTSTKDPMKDAPTGATGFENGKYYMVGENGDKYFYDKTREQFYWENKADGYTYYYFPKTGEQEAYLARPWIEDYYAYDYEDVSAIPMDIWVKYGTPGSESIIKMTHRDVTSADDLGKTPDSMNKYLIDKFGIVDPSDLMKSGSDFTHAFTFNGEDLVADFSNKGGFQITFVSEEELKPLVAEKKAVQSSGNLAKGFIILSYDKAVNGKVQVRIASSLPLDELLDRSPSGDPQYEFRYMVFLALMNILVADDGTDLNDFAALTPASLVAADSARPRPGDGAPDLDIVVKP